MFPLCSHNLRQYHYLWYRKIESTWLNFLDRAGCLHIVSIYYFRLRITEMSLFVQAQCNRRIRHTVRPLYNFPVINYATYCTQKIVPKAVLSLPCYHLIFLHGICIGRRKTWYINAWFSICSKSSCPKCIIYFTHDRSIYVWRVFYAFKFYCSVVASYHNVTHFKIKRQRNGLV